MQSLTAREWPERRRLFGRRFLRCSTPIAETYFLKLTLHNTAELILYAVRKGVTT
jgi:hypothetical protein